MADSQIDLQPSVIAYVVGQLQGFSLLASPVDVKGVAYEEIVGSNLRGDRGEFFTPRNACRMAVAMLNPQPDERLLDPACGTGGFLITAMNHALEFIEVAEREEWEDPAIGTDAERQELYRRRGGISFDFRIRDRSQSWPRARSEDEHGYEQRRIWGGFSRRTVS